MVFHKHPPYVSLLFCHQNLFLRSRIIRHAPMIIIKIPIPIII
jgi:hypothetical protein